MEKYSNLDGTQLGENLPDRKIGIKTQQGLSQFVLWLSEEDAKIYWDLLKRNNIWCADVTKYE